MQISLRPLVGLPVGLLAVGFTTVLHRWFGLDELALNAAITPAVMVASIALARWLRKRDGKTKPA